MKTINIHRELSEFQKTYPMPIKILSIADRVTDALVVTTPHKGNVIIDLTETAVGHGLFGVTAIEKGNKEASKITKELEELRIEAQKYLFNQWTESLQD